MMYLSKVSLRRDIGVESIAPILLPNDSHQRIGTSHRLMWTLFDSSEQSDMDFLWKEVDNDVFYVLSQRAPNTNGVLSAITKPFNPVFQEGQLLSFSMRVNATVSVGGSAATKTHGKRRSLLTTVVQSEGYSREDKEKLFDAAATAWLARQGVGVFEVKQVSVQAENFVRIPYKGISPITFDAIDMTGQVVVKDPVAFKTKLLHGFGRAKAFGCGLMLVKPA